MLAQSCTNDVVAAAFESHLLDLIRWACFVKLSISFFVVVQYWLIRAQKKWSCEIPAEESIGTLFPEGAFINDPVIPALNEASHLVNVVSCLSSMDVQGDYDPCDASGFIRINAVRWAHDPPPSPPHTHARTPTATKLPLMNKPKHRLNSNHNWTVNNCPTMMSSFYRPPIGCSEQLAKCLCSVLRAYKQLIISTSDVFGILVYILRQCY